MQRLVVFLLYDPAGRADAGVLRYLRGLRPHAVHMHVVVNGPLAAGQRDLLLDVVDTVQERENEGFDVGGYRDAINTIGPEILHSIDELLLTNYTNLGPIGPDGFDPLFAHMDAVDADIWGLTEHGALIPDPYTHRGMMPEHLQSHWIAVRGNVLRSPAWRSYWMDMPPIRSYEDSVRRHEVRFTKYMRDAGFTVRAAFQASVFEVANPCMEAPLELLQAGCPVVKRRLFFHDPLELDHRGVDAREVLHAVTAAGYPAELVAASIAPVVRPRVANANLGGARVLRPLVRELQPTPSVVPGSVNVGGLVVRVLEASMWPLLADDAETFLRDVDVIITSSPIRAMSAEPAATARAVRDAKAAFVSDPSPVAWLLADEPAIGAVVPLTPHIGTELAGHGWQGRARAAADLAARLGLDGQLDEHTPIAPYAGIAAVRASALRELALIMRAQGGWDRIAAATPGGDAELVVLLDLLLSRIIGNAGHITVEAGTREQLETWASHWQTKAIEIGACLPRGVREPVRMLRARSAGRRHVMAEWLLRHAPGPARMLRAARAIFRR